MFTAVMLCAILLVGMGFTSLYVRQTAGETKNHDLTVVTSFYPMYIAAMNVIDDAEHVKLKNLSEPQTGCLHDFQLTPEDMKLLSTADVFIINGGGIENFMEEVAKTYPNLTIIEACKNTSLLAEDIDENGHEEDEHAGEEHEEGHVHEDTDVNAHAWMSVSAYESQVQTIAEGLSQADPKHREQYETSAGEYLEKLDKLKARQEQIREEAAGQSVILFHEAYAYVAEDYGLPVSYVMDLDEERKVSAGEVASVLSAIKNNQTKIILAEERYGKSMGDTVSAESDAKVLYLSPLNRGEYEKDSYIDGMEKNMEILEEAFHAQNH